MYLIGYITKPQGIKGEVKVEPVTPDPKRFNRLKSVFLQIKNKSQTYPIEKIRVSDRFVYIKFFGVNSCDDAELLRNADVLIEEKDLIQPERDEYFVHDLVGCRVISEDNDEIGIVSEVVQMTSNDIYVVKNENGTEFLVPATKQVIKQVDVGQRLITIHILEGLFD
jgi:16S rRNA processing protein RimM